MRVWGKVLLWWVASGVLSMVLSLSGAPAGVCGGAGVVEGGGWCVVVLVSRREGVVSSVGVALGGSQRGRGL